MLAHIDVSIWGAFERMEVTALHVCVCMHASGHMYVSVCVNFDSILSRILCQQSVKFFTSGLQACH